MSPGERACWDPPARGNPPMGLSNLGVRDAVTAARGRGEQDFLSSAGNASQLGGLPFLCSPRLHPSLWGSWSGATGTLGCWRGAEPLDPAARCLVPSFLCHPAAVPRVRVPRRDVAALGGPLCCCARRRWVTPPRWGTGSCLPPHGDTEWPQRDSGYRGAHGVLVGSWCWLLGSGP